MSSDKAHRYDRYMLSALLWAAVFCASTYVVYKMTINSPEPYTSDYPAHISSALNGTGYSLMEIIFRALYMLTGNTVLISVFIGILTSCTGIAVQSLVRYISGIEDKYTIIFSYGSLFLASLYIPIINPYWYIWSTDAGNISSLLTQPWHNSTYVGMRFFAVISFGLFMKCWNEAETKVRIRDLVLLWIMLSVTNLFKPNFIIAFAPAVLIVFIISLIKNHAAGLKEYLKICVAGIASMFPLIIQYKILFVSDETGGWTVSSARFATYVHQYEGVFIIAANLLFPIVITVLMLLRREEQSVIRPVALAWIMEIICILECMFLAETGSRANDGNFSWGIYATTLILFITSFAAYIRMRHHDDGRYSGAMTFSGWLLIMHIAAGLMYFGDIFRGYPYLC